MTVSIADFWKLFGQSRLLPLQQVQQLAAEFGQAEATKLANAKAAAEWLLSRNAVTRYQAAILLAGKSGPFFFGDYKLQERIEKGRLGGCFRAVHSPTGHPVLLQFLTGPVSKEPALWAAAAKEILAASRVVSPHVQRLFEPVDLGAFKFVVSEDLRGNSLEERLAAGRLPAAQACRLVHWTALGLADLHGGGRIHGDVRPANILLAATPNSTAQSKLLIEPQRTLAPLDLTPPTEPGSRLALAADYLAPELLTAGHKPDSLSDVYALGCTLYAMLAGTPPFAGGSVQEKMSRHATEAIRPLDEFGVPKALTQVVAYMMAKNPAVRFQSAAIVVERMAGFVEAASLTISPAAPAASLGPFEQALQQKHPESSPPQPPPPSPPSQRAVASPPPTKSTPPSSAIAVTPRLSVEVTAKPRSGASAAALVQRRKSQQRRRMIIGLFVAAVVVVGGGVGGAFWWRKRQEQPPAVASLTGQDQGEAPETGTDGGAQVTPASASSGTPAASGDKTSAGGSGTPPAVGKEKSGSGTTVTDDGKILWASPTAGKPISFRCVPPEGQLFLVVRPAAMLASPEGQRIFQALGPGFAKLKDDWENSSGLKLDEVEQLIITLHNNDAKFPRVSYVVKTKEALTPEKLLERWKSPAEAEETSQKYYTGTTSAYYISSAPQDERTFAMGEAVDIKEVAAAGGAAPPLLHIERLLRTSDTDRHCTLLFYPQFLFNDDGEPLFQAERAKIRQPLNWLLGDNLQAAAVSLHCGEAFYLEIRMLGSLDKEPYKLAEELKARMNEIPPAIETYIDGIFPPPYWSRLARRYPLMVGQLHEQMRIGVENDQAIANSVLPSSAGHNLVLGGELLVSTAPGQAAAGVAAGAQPPAGPKSIAELRLQIKTSYSFDQQSLEFAMRDLAEDVTGNLKGASFEFAIKILGDDLKIDGITRNQSIRDFKQDNQTVADILTALVRKANPVTTVKDPAEKDQKLIWVIGPDPDNAGKQIVLITTRTAAATRKYSLPAPFVEKKT